MPVTPQPGTNVQIVTGGTAVQAVPANPNGGYIVNPYTATDQGIITAEVLYVNSVTTATLAGNGTTVALQPGQSYSIIPGQTTATSVNAATSGHKFTAVYW